MTLPDSILVVVFIMAVVFSVLIALSLIIKVFSKAVNFVTVKSGKKETETDIVQIKAVPESADEISGGDFSAGTLTLKNVEEPTAAMIMAIVSDESGIPLSELCFKSITLVNE